MRLLYITSLSGKRINGFMRSAIIAAGKVGLEFVMACNTDMADKNGYEEDCNDYKISVCHIDFERNPLSLKNGRAYKQLLDLMKSEHFDIVHCNTPIGGLIGRICARKAGIQPVIYMAHGFHFWKGAPLKNWCLYYPAERFLAHYTDELITINSEDYERARHFHLRNRGAVRLIHGVGVDTNRFSEAKAGNIRDELNLQKNTTIFLSVGELIHRKNHLNMIKAFVQAGISNAVLLICGDGELRLSLEEYLQKQKITCVKLLGFRSDIPELLASSEFFILPSFQEGLPGALMEAMASSVACIASNIRGNTDLLGEDYEYLFDPYDTNELAYKIKSIINDRDKCVEVSKRRIKDYDFANVVKEFESLYNDWINNN